MELHGIKGLTHAQVAARRTKAVSKKGKPWVVPVWLIALKDLLTEPMILLLLITSAFYFTGGQWQDGVFLLASVIILAVISLYQENRSRTAIDSLQQFSTNKCKVIRDGAVVEILTSELVTDDAVIIDEGALIPADGVILHANDFSVDESILTGESFPVTKNAKSRDHVVYQGTAASTGLAIVQVTAVAEHTRLSGIGRDVAAIQAEKTPFQKQIGNFVLKMAIAGGIVFMLDWLINYFHSYSVKDSLLKALTLAMSVLPEEIPVAFSTFMAIGAWKLMKMGIIVKDLNTVEALGSATVICLDKTGTITQNKMSLARIWSADTKRISDADSDLNPEEILVVETAMWASEPIPFDTMEKAIHLSYERLAVKDLRVDFHMVHEYPLSGKPPMMTHIFTDGEGHQLVACKGAPEAILKVCGRSEDKEVLDAVVKLTSQGFRVLGVANAADMLLSFPHSQQEISFTFQGLIAFYDPPKDNIKDVLQSFYKAGIDMKMLTGDNPLTSAAIARQVGMEGADELITGEEIMNLTDDELREQVQDLHLFTRMFPEAKLRVINMLKTCGEVVAMTGDGVNDGPALKSAHIGISMGKGGTAIAREAGTLILLNDDLQGMVDAIAQGRRIYNNLKKAIRYIISIHIPIILTVFVPLLFTWVYPNIFSPVHIIFLELIMGPTCSLIYENEPMEKNTMTQKPRPRSADFFNYNELATSVLQGLVIAAGVLFIYSYAVHHHLNLQVTRSMVFTTLITANITLTLVNRSFYYSVFTTLGYQNRLVWIIIGIATALLAASLYIRPFSTFFGFSVLHSRQLIISAGSGILLVVWYEVIKAIRRK